VGRRLAAGPPPQLCAACRRRFPRLRYGWVDQGYRGQFLVEGLGFGALGWIVLGSGRRRRWWVGTAITAISVLIVIGMLSATSVIGKTIIG
jgi:hypothetical protein